MYVHIVGGKEEKKEKKAGQSVHYRFAACKTLIFDHFVEISRKPLETPFFF